MMNNKIIHRADSRGRADHGWLKSFQTFSFAGYYDPERIQFGALRVLNDDEVSGGRGFGEHPHDNMEIISIPLEGRLRHQDSMGNMAIIEAGEIQVMSAGTGVYHSEYNPDLHQPARFLQIWLFPGQRNVTPRYDQQKLDRNAAHNNYLQILSPDAGDAGVWIHQQAWFHLARFDQGFSREYTLKKPGNGVYIFVLSGQLEVDGERLDARDGLGLTGVTGFTATALTGTEFLVMEVPMEV